VRKTRNESLEIKKWPGHGAGIYTLGGLLKLRRRARDPIRRKNLAPAAGGHKRRRRANHINLLAMNGLRPRDSGDSCCGLFAPPPKFWQSLARNAAERLTTHGSTVKRLKDGVEFGKLRPEQRPTDPFANGPKDPRGGMEWSGRTIRRRQRACPAGDDEKLAGETEEVVETEEEDW